MLLARPQWGQEWHPNRVVVGLDGSEPSLAALAAADELAARLGSELEVVTATGGNPVERDGGWIERVTRWDAEHPVASLRDRSTTADLVIVGSRGLHGMSALGSVAERIAHRALCSVLVVQSPPPD